MPLIRTHDGTCHNGHEPLSYHDHHGRGCPLCALLDDLERLHDAGLISDAALTVIHIEHAPHRIPKR